MSAAPAAHDATEAAAATAFGICPYFSVSLGAAGAAAYALGKSNLPLRSKLVLGAGASLAAQLAASNSGATFGPTARKAVYAETPPPANPVWDTTAGKATSALIAGAWALPAAAAMRANIDPRWAAKSAPAAFVRAFGVNALLCWGLIESNRERHRRGPTMQLLTGTHASSHAATCDGADVHHFEDPAMGRGAAAPVATDRLPAASRTRSVIDTRRQYHPSHAHLMRPVKLVGVEKPLPPWQLLVERSVMPPTPPADVHVLTETLAPCQARTISRSRPSLPPAALAALVKGDGPGGELSPKEGVPSSDSEDVLSPVASTVSLGSPPQSPLELDAAALPARPESPPPAGPVDGVKPAKAWSAALTARRLALAAQSLHLAGPEAQATPGDTDAGSGVTAGPPPASPRAQQACAAPLQPVAREFPAPPQRAAPAAVISR